MFRMPPGSTLLWQRSHSSTSDLMASSQQLVYNMFLPRWSIHPRRLERFVEHPLGHREAQAELTLTDDGYQL
jgi:hypothetical protein